MRALSSGKSRSEAAAAFERGGDEQVEVDAGEVALLDERHGRDLAVRALDLLDDRPPDPAHGDAPPLGGRRGRANVGLGHAPARTGSLDRRELDGELTCEPVQRERLERLRADDGDDRLGGRAAPRAAASRRSGAGARRRRRSSRASRRPAAISPSRATMRRTTPSTGEPISTVALSVWISTIGSFSLDRVALAHEPARDLALGQPFAQIRQRERVRHAREGTWRPETVPYVSTVSASRSATISASSMSPMSSPSTCAGSGESQRITIRSRSWPRRTSPAPGRPRSACAASRGIARGAHLDAARRCRARPRRTRRARSAARAARRRCTASSSRRARTRRGRAPRPRATGS